MKPDDWVALTRLWIRLAMVEVWVVADPQPWDTDATCPADLIGVPECPAGHLLTFAEISSIAWLRKFRLDLWPEWYVHVFIWSDRRMVFLVSRRISPNPPMPPSWALRALRALVDDQAEAK